MLKRGSAPSRSLVACTSNEWVADKSRVVTFEGEHEVDGLDPLRANPGAIPDAWPSGRGCGAGPGRRTQVAVAALAVVSGLQKGLLREGLRPARQAEGGEVADQLQPRTK